MIVSSNHQEHLLVRVPNINSARLGCKPEHSLREAPRSSRGKTPFLATVRTDSAIF
jgi:hypothetical protein